MRERNSEREGYSKRRKEEGKLKSTQGSSKHNYIDYSIL